MNVQQCTMGRNHILTRIYNSKYVSQTFQKLLCKLMEFSKSEITEIFLLNCKCSKFKKILCKDLGPIIKCYITNLDFTQNDKVIITVSGFLKAIYYRTAS